MPSPALQKRYIPKVKKREESLQLRVCNWLKLNYPNIIFRSDYASGLYMTPDKARTHARLQSSRSFPDLFIFAGRKGYKGFALELKKEGTAIKVKIGPNKGHLVANKHIREQYLLLKQLISEGYYANFAIGYEDALRQIQWYFGVPVHERQTLF